MTDIKKTYFISSDEIWKGRRLSKNILNKIIELTLKETNKSKIKDVRLEILYINDEEMQKYNLQTRNINKPTNVLSFENNFKNATTFLDGSIILSFEIIKKEALEEKKSFRKHLIYLFIHGFLHVLGYDHQTDKEADEMEALERKIISLI